MGLEDAFDLGLLVDVGAAFVVDDKVVAFGVIGIADNRERRFGGFVVGVDLIDGDVDAGFEACFEDVFLFAVFVAATAGDEKGFEGGGVGCLDGKGEGGGEEEFGDGHAGRVAGKRAVVNRVLN